MSNGERRPNDGPIRSPGAAHLLPGARPPSELITGVETRHQSAQIRAIADMPMSNVSAQIRAIVDMPAPNLSAQIRAIADMSAPNLSAQIRAIADMPTPNLSAQIRAIGDMPTPNLSAQIRAIADMPTPNLSAQIRAIADMPAPNLSAQIRAITDMPAPNLSVEIPALANIPTPNLPVQIPALADIPTPKLNQQLGTITGLSPLIGGQHVKMAEIAPPLSADELHATAKALRAVTSPLVRGVRPSPFAGRSRGLERLVKVVHTAESSTRIQAERRTVVPPEQRDRARETPRGRPGYADEAARPLNLRSDSFLCACIEDVNRCLAEDRPALAVDRAHSAIHRVLQLLAEEAGCARDGREKLTKLFHSVRSHHPAFSISGADEVATELFGKLSSILETLNELRNQHSYAHPTDAIPSGPWARFATETMLSVIELLMGLSSEYHLGRRRGDRRMLN